MRALLIASLAAMGWSAAAQDLGVLDRPQAWTHDPVWDPGWERTKGTVILADTLEVRFHGVKPQFLNVFFERRRIIRFETEADILRHGSVQLPESLDPPMDRGERIWDPLAENPGPRWLNVRLDRFMARVLRPDGSAHELEPLVRVRRWPVKNPTTIEQAWSFTFDLPAIAPGDVVELHWKYMVPYDLNQPATQGWRSAPWMDNWARLTSWRIFFHDALPVRAQQVTIRYLRKQGLSFSGEGPHALREDGEALAAVWRHTGLPGCMDEVNARPADDLPHIVLRLEVEDLRYWARDRLSHMPVQQSPWMYVVRHREMNALWLERVARKKVPDRQNQLVKDFIAATTTGLSDRPVARRIEALHERIAMDFAYDPDRDWYADVRGTDQRMGDQVADALLRDISRHDLYVKLIAHHRLAHSTAYALDRRAGVLTPDHLTPVWDLEQLIGIEDGAGMLWMHPKRRRTGLLANELPFYWAGTPALRADVTRLAMDGPQDVAFTRLPSGDPGHDRRNIAMEVDVDPRNGTCTARVQVRLAGQFSTVGRGAWCHAEPDPAVHTGYGHRPQDAGRCMVLRQEASPLSTDPPFTTTITQLLDLGPRLNRVNDTAWTLDLAHLLMHAVPAPFDAAARALPFHWDFIQLDLLEVSVRHPDGMVLRSDIPSGSWRSPGAMLDVQVGSTGGTATVSSQLSVTNLREGGPDHRALSDLLTAARGIHDLRLLLVEERQGQ
ncbi:MAG TPA: hypothetical protein PKE21_02140 [Flavobacteriales bacterium]|nr:hypothetical protein [Flavobacteriales bacterium]HMR26254.1 hypothetical protein [Flavobacteriales bacterium]